MSFASLSESAQTIAQPFSPNTKIIYQNPDFINLNAIHGDAIIVSNGVAYFIRDHQFLSHTATEKNDTILLMNHKTLALTVGIDRKSIKNFLSELSNLAIRYEEADQNPERWDKDGKLIKNSAITTVNELITYMWLDMRSQIKKLITMPEVKEAAMEPTTHLRKLIAWEFSKERLTQAKAIIEDIIVILTKIDSAKSTTSEEGTALLPKSTTSKENAALTQIKAIRETAQCIPITSKIIPEMLALLAEREKIKKKKFEEFKIAMKKNEIFPLIFYQILQIINAISSAEITIDNYRAILAGAYTLCMKYNRDSATFTSEIADLLKIDRRLLCQYERTVAELIDFKIPHEDALLDELTGNKEISSVIKTIICTIDPEGIMPITPAMIPLLIQTIIEQLENKEKLLLIQEINSRLALLQLQANEKSSCAKSSNELAVLLTPKNLILSLFEKKELPENKLHRFLSGAQTPADFQACLKAMLNHFDSNILPLKAEDIGLIILNTTDNPLLIQQFLQKILTDKQPHLIAALMDCFQTEDGKKIIFSALEDSANLTLIKMLFDLLITVAPAQNEALVKLTVLDSTATCAKIYLNKFSDDTENVGMIVIAHADKTDILLHIKSVIGFDQFHPDDLIALYLKLDALRLSEVNSHNAKALLSNFSASDYSRMLASTNVDNLSTLFANSSFKIEIIKEGKLETFCMAIIQQKIAEQLFRPLLNTKILINYANLLATIFAPMIRGTQKSNYIRLLIEQYQLTSQRIQENLPDKHPYVPALKERSEKLTGYLIQNSFLEQPKESSGKAESLPNSEIKAPLKLEI